MLWREIVSTDNDIANGRLNLSTCTRNLILQVTANRFVGCFPQAPVRWDNKTFTKANHAYLSSAFSIDSVRLFLLEDNLL
jgi:hypothetical protein